ncbi:acyl-CoA synthetase [Lewinella sp. 4G2]|uniref:acyl-CoA synthetase n=1 Tax=Lewinella sp. 4G2 TaxID=1803372 RepID=UPI0007B4CAA9|nr:acyl-CoA synthetase [Lewinella sp. 4G2]OAV43113.1 long-chain fatty acid--CoA ligase [Lewinella sp. 4G2]
MQELIFRARNFGDREAIKQGDQVYTYAKLLTDSARVARQLLDGRDDLKEARIAFLVSPSYAYVVCQWAIWRAGGIAVPLCVDHPVPALRYVLEDTAAQTLIIHPDFTEKMRATTSELGLQLLALPSTLIGTTWALSQVPGDGQANGADGQGEDTPLPKVAPERRAQILYTSGTTSLPKGVVTTHANIRQQITTLVDAWEWSEDDRILNILPLHHVHGIINVLSCALWSGARCEFPEQGFRANEVWEKMAANEITRFMAVPTIYYKLISYWEKLGESDQTRLSAGAATLNLMISGSAALPVPTLERWREITGQTLLERYGMTEIGMGLSNSYRGERRPGHVGLPLPGVEMRLADENQETIHREHVPGQIQIKGPSVFLEYWNKPEATAKSFTADGWFLTGDVAELNDGLYRILGRNSVDIIKSGGYKISALEIEAVLLAHPAVDQCAVVGLPDQEWGEVVAAAVVTREENPDWKAITAWLKERIPGYRLPRRWLKLDELPRNTIGKVTKNELKTLF